jgi:hypothetical protein
VTQSWFVETERPSYGQQLAALVAILMAG